ncbi:hypothetical protein OPT61_g7688 [Boeremia exigua]|uniref:Uncharacterized protein n=1 Tax=Boeremia exigua TaxID=749465 RepID=A0ACC2I2E2_9PLEO|nr:hypothetical protein OPT61_g7688 [Boeremia exigua]
MFNDHDILAGQLTSNRSTVIKPRSVVSEAVRLQPELGNSERNRRDMEMTGLSEKLLHSFMTCWAPITPHGLTGFGSRRLAIQEQSVLLITFALLHGGIGTVLVVSIIVSPVYGLSTKRLADMAGDIPIRLGYFNGQRRLRQFEQPPVHRM